MNSTYNSRNDNNNEYPNLQGTNHKMSLFFLCPSLTRIMLKIAKQDIKVREILLRTVVEQMPVNIYYVYDNVDILIEPTKSIIDKIEILLTSVIKPFWDDFEANKLANSNYKKIAFSKILEHIKDLPIDEQEQIFNELFNYVNIFEQVLMKVAGLN